MNYFWIDYRPLEDPNLCFLRDFPEGVGANRYKLLKGEAFGDAFSRDARVFMSDEEEGMQLATLIGNTGFMLILHNDAVTTIKQVNQGPIEFLPITLMNHKKRVASRDYFIVNPLGDYDVLDQEESSLEMHEGEISRVKKAVLDAEKLTDVPDLFRLRGRPSMYVASERLLDALFKESGFTPTNIYARKLKVAKA